MEHYKPWLARQRQIDDDASALELEAQQQQQQQLQLASTLCVPTSIFLASLTTSCRKYCQCSKHNEQSNTAAIRSDAPLQFQLHRAKGPSHRPNHRPTNNRYVGTLFHPCFLFTFAGIIRVMCDVPASAQVSDTRAVNTLSHAAANVKR